MTEIGSDRDWRYLFVITYLFNLIISYYDIILMILQANMIR